MMKIANMELQQVILSGLFVLLIIFGISILTYNYISPSFSVIGSLSAGSTYAVALLTVVYALTTSKQLSIMASQLDEMKNDRELQNQPMPWIRDTQFVVERPRLYYSPPEDEFSFIPRYTLNLSLKNIGDSPAVAINITASIAIPGEPKINSDIRYNSISKHINIIEPNNVFPPHPSHGVPLYFTPLEKMDAALLSAMREKDVKLYPILIIKIIYKNMLGGCFLIQNIFKLYPTDIAQRELFKNWTTQVTAFPVQYKDELISLRRLLKKDYNKYQELFNKIQTDISEATTESKLELSLEPMPRSLKSKVISEDEYQKYCENLRYGLRLSPFGGCSECEEKICG